MAKTNGDGSGVRVKVWADGRVSVILYKVTDGKVADDLGYRVIEKSCLLDDGTWHVLKEGESQTFLSKVGRQVLDPTDPTSFL